MISAEVEVALALAEHLMVELGASPEQIDRSRARARDELGTAAADSPERASVVTRNEA